MNRNDDDFDVYNIAPWANIHSPDIICFLVPTSDAARRDVAQLASEPVFSQHVVARPYADGHPTTHAIALRLSAAVKEPLHGFMFGRSARLCDVYFATGDTAPGGGDGKGPAISVQHFRIFLDAAGGPVLQDSKSDHGTWVNHVLLLSPFERKRRSGSGGDTMALEHGAHITLALPPELGDLSFFVCFPFRDDGKGGGGENRELFRNNLKAYQKRLSLLSSRK